jgi:hypothetical protein
MENNLQHDFIYEEEVTAEDRREARMRKGESINSDDMGI